MPTHDTLPDITVVIATRNRATELRRCLAAIVVSPPRAAYEIIVVDDGSDVAISDDSGFTMLRCEGVGPARARNIGIAAARAPVVLFTDDDTIPHPGWVDAAHDFLTTHPDCVGVEGPTLSPPFDPLYFNSVRSSTPGSYLTCNIAYRRSALQQVAGFAEVFPFAHAEDLDLGVRITQLGALGYSTAMTVVHPPRAVPLLAQVRKGRIMASEATLYTRHPDVYPVARYLSGSGYALALNLKRWVHSAVRGTHGVGRNPWRLLRFTVLAVGYSLEGAAVLITRALR